MPRVRCDTHRFSLSPDGCLVLDGPGGRSAPGVLTTRRFGGLRELVPFTDVAGGGVGFHRGDPGRWVRILNRRTVEDPTPEEMAVMVLLRIPVPGGLPDPWRLRDLYGGPLPVAVTGVLATFTGHLDGTGARGTDLLGWLPGWATPRWWVARRAPSAGVLAARTPLWNLVGHRLAGDLDDPGGTLGAPWGPVVSRLHRWVTGRDGPPVLGLDGDGLVVAESPRRPLGRLDWRQAGALPPPVALRILDTLSAGTWTLPVERIHPNRLVLSRLVASAARAPGGGARVTRGLVERLVGDLNRGVRCPEAAGALADAARATGVDPGPLALWAPARLLTGWRVLQDLTTVRHGGIGALLATTADPDPRPVAG